MRYIIIMCLFSASALASESTSTFNVNVKVPVVCELVNEVPKCNLVLTKTSDGVWEDKDRGYRITLSSGFIVIEELK